MNPSAKFPTTIILAGGLGTRLGAVAGVTPKCMMPLAGEPFIAHQLRLLHREGIRKIVLCVGHLGEQVEEFVGDGARFGIEVNYVFDGNRLLGTGGAIRRAMLAGALDGEQCFGVIYGDSYLDVQFPPIFDAYRASGKRALMTVLLNENRWDKSNVIMRDTMIAVYDKKSQSPEMRHIDFGLLIFAASCFDSYEANLAFDLSALLGDLVARQELAAFEVTQRFYEIGTPDSLAETERYIVATAAAR